MDYARGVAILLVAYRHVFEGIKSSGISVENYMYLEHFNIAFFSFRMPLFFIVSGIFLSASFSKRGLRKYVENKAKIILWPYFLWGILQITLQIIFSGYVNRTKTVYSYLYLLYQPVEIEQFWYLYALFNVSVLYVFLKYVIRLKTWHQVILAAAMYFGCSYFNRQSINLGFLLDIFHNYIFILIGDMIHTWIRDSNRIKMFQEWKTFFILIIPFAATQGYFLYRNIHSTVNKYRFVEYYEPTIFLVIALTGCAFVICCCFLLQRYNKQNWLRVLGRNSLYIYVSHVIIFAAFRVLLTRIFHIYNVPFLLIVCIAIGVTIPVFLFRLSERLGMEWIFTLEKPGKTQYEKNNIAVSEARIAN